MESVPLPREIAVQVQRAARRALWLDTSIIIKIANARRGRLTNHPTDLDRVTEIDRVITEKVRSGRLLCLDSEQRYETWVSGFEHFMDTMKLLSMGAQLRPLHSVRLAQVSEAMLAYLQRADSISLPLRTFYDGNPCRIVDENLQRRFLITVRMPQHEEVRRHRAQKKRELHGQLEQIRRRNVQERVTFEQQLERENRSTLRAYVEMFKKAVFMGVLDPEMKDNETFWHMIGGAALSEVMDLWARLGGERRELARFYDSDYFRALPQEDIQSRIYASLMTQHEPIKASDSGDVDHLALELPVADFVVTDISMERRVRKLGLDMKWDTRVFSLRSTDELLAALAAL
jgi:hypothetical protein